MIIFPHIPKTGGTTVLNHFRTEKGNDQVLSLGPNSRVYRFLNGIKQIEELDGKGLKDLFCIQGHGVSDLNTLYANPADLKLMVVLRGPDGHTRSRFNHRRNARLKKTGVELTSEMFMERFFRDDFQCTYLISKFPSFIDNGAETRFEKAVSILRKFNYVLVTEALDDQFAMIASGLGMSPTLERKRTAEQKTELLVSKEEVLARQQGDLALVEKVMAHDGRDAPEMFNPFGYDAAGRASALRRVKARAHEASVEAGYVELASGLCMQMRAEQVLFMLKRAPRKLPVNDPDLLRDILQKKWDDTSKKLTAVQAEKSERHLKRERNGVRRLKSRVRKALS
ncbi:hypothetical protein [Celeribacter sp. PS-C1]|uniref:hypothetical protein n=1 Tax=Celeribacter sp. PS-C1 TaxID=2820813 RepID=UPI001CA5A633|nr:hypothetical protein [Celeribacter sp. PS-C1]MBW6416189.1 hypothetical protein [Celeribacter sp. PS-C1]